MDVAALLRKLGELEGRICRVEVPIGNEAARSQLRRALATRLQSIATKDQRSLLIEREILHAADELEASEGSLRNTNGWY